MIIHSKKKATALSTCIYLLSLYFTALCAESEGPVVLLLSVGRENVRMRGEPVVNGGCASLGRADDNEGWRTHNHRRHFLPNNAGTARPAHGRRDFICEGTRQ